MSSLPLSPRRRRSLAAIFRRPPSPDRVIDLTSRQQEVLELRRGETVLLQHGAATLVLAARWVGETLVQPRVALRENDAYVAQEPGVVTVVAGMPSRVRLVSGAGHRRAVGERRVA